MGNFFQKSPPLLIPPILYLSETEMKELIENEPENVYGNFRTLKEAVYTIDKLRIQPNHRNYYILKKGKDILYADE
jgi:hypothetical protein